MNTLLHRLKVAYEAFIDPTLLKSQIHVDGIRVDVLPPAPSDHIFMVIENTPFNVNDIVSVNTRHGREVFTLKNVWVELSFDVVKANHFVSPMF